MRVPVVVAPPLDTFPRGRALSGWLFPGVSPRSLPAPKVLKQTVPMLRARASGSISVI